MDDLIIATPNNNIRKRFKLEITASSHNSLARHLPHVYQYAGDKARKVNLGLKINSTYCSTPICLESRLTFDYVVCLVGGPMSTHL